MNQILNIFRKDTRRFWPEIALSVIAVFAFALVFPNEWRVFHDQSVQERMSIMLAVLGILMVTGWWLLIARAVHAESLVGDQQFWITRPYEWKKLLAAKALFLAAWIGVPYLLAQLLLLAEAGFHPLAYMPGLLFNLLLFSTSFLLPMVALAAVTSNFARLTMTVLGVLIVFSGYMFLINGIPHGYTSTNPYTNTVLVPLLLAGCAAAIGLQYATRRVWVSRGLLIALPILMAVSVAAYRRQSLVDRAYPAPSAAAAVPLIIASMPNAAHPVEARSWEGEDYIDLPVQYGGVAEGTAVFADDFKFSITAADGSQWSSPWQSIQERTVNNAHSSGLSLMIDPALYERFKTAPVTLRITFAVSRYQSDTVTKMAFTAGDAAIPGIGFCASEYSSTMICRAALRGPRLTHVTMLWSHGACPDAQTSPVSTAEDDAWLGPGGINIAPGSVWTMRMFFFHRSNEDSDYSHWHICPGSPLTLTQYNLLERTQASMTLTNFVLPANVVPTS
ncbi:MAG: hypothetical protein ABR889_01080 [Acidobacteriaceae bacterium]|jgi:uncharacterized membrane protein